MRTAERVFATIGVLSVIAIFVGATIDIASFDRTRGGYEPPYTEVTGEPIDWMVLDKTPTGLVSRGFVIDTHVNGTTGMISFEIFRLTFNYRPLSERALVVHGAREGLIQRGFEPAF